MMVDINNEHEAKQNQKKATISKRMHVMKQKHLLFIQLKGKPFEQKLIEGNKEEKWNAQRVSPVS